MHATGPIAIASIQVASTANSIHRGQSSVRRASPTHGGRWLAQTTYDALMTHHTTENILIGWVAMAVPRGGQEPLPLKVAPIQPSVTAAFHLQSRWDSDCQMWELKNAGACIWISLQRFTLKYIMNTYDRTNACFTDIRSFSAHVCHIFRSKCIEVYWHTCSSI